MSSKHLNHWNISTIAKITAIVMMDILATMGSFFFGLWLRYEFVFSDIRADHLQGYLEAIVPWCIITVAVLALFKL